MEPLQAEIRRSTCVMDCPDACHLEVVVEGERILRIGGGHDHPDTAGFICGKVAHFARRVDAPERIATPLRRVGRKGEGRFKPATWDEALPEIAARLRSVRDRWGGEAILGFHYGGSNGWLTDDLTDDLFFARLGASRLQKTICAAVTTAVATAMYGKMPGVAFADYSKAACIVIWGANPRASNIHLVPYLQQAKANGAFLATVDPRRTVGGVDLHLPVLPGADAPVALAMIAHWERTGRLDRAFLEGATTGAEALLSAARAWPLARAAAAAGVDFSAIARLADAFADASPAVVRCGWGIERNRNGAASVAAVLALPAVLGKFGVSGGGYTLSNSGAYKLDRAAVLGPLEWRSRSLNMSQLGRLLRDGRGEPAADASEAAPRATPEATGLDAPPLDPPIKALFVYNANPVATVPDQTSVLAGLAREDLFTVVHEQVMTDTALWADWVLPATTFLEHWDLKAGYGSYALGGVRPVIAPRGAARSNTWLFSGLAREMGFDDEPFRWSDEELFARTVAAATVAGHPADGERLASGGMQRPDFPGVGPVQFGSVAPAAGGRADLAPPLLGARPYGWTAPEPGFPLALVTPASGQLISSTMGEFNLPELAVTLHPAEAAARGIADRQAVRVFNRQGEVRCRARVSDEVRPGVVAMPKGAWRRASANGSTAAALCPDHVSAEAGGACFNDARVEVEPAP